jgi:hypothetical protein
MVFETHFSRSVFDDEVNEGKKIVETAGYVPAKKQIENLLLAGEKLVAYRKGMYDYEPDDDSDDDDFNDPTRVPGFDMADSSQLQSELEGRIKAQEAAAAAAAKEDTKKPEKIDPGASTKPQEEKKEAPGESKKEAPDSV